VLTSDNPRSEEPAHILNAMAAGLERPAQAQVLADRAQAIAQASGTGASAVAQVSSRCSGKK
jgi:UDP-N-acetylmuramyl tripeptide synthase